MKTSGKKELLVVLENRLQAKEEQLQREENKYKDLEHKYNHLESKYEKQLEELTNFRKLKTIGNVYNKEQTEKTKTFRQLMKDAILTEQYHYLDFGLVDQPDGSQKRSKEKKLIYSHYLTLSKHLARQYSEEFGRAPSRFKGKITTRDMVKGRSCIGNEYPKNYIGYIHEYLKEHPIETWSSLSKDFKYNEEDESKIDCAKCNKIINLSSLKKHLKSKNHLK